MFSVYANNWPIVWGDEREISYEPDSLIKIEDPIKPPFDRWQTGYLNLCWYDIHSLRVNRKLILSGVYAEKDGRIFVGDIQKRDHQRHGKMHEFKLELENVFISHEELQRVINGEAGDWECETEVVPMTATVGDQTVRNDEGGKRESKRDLKSTEDVEREAKTASNPTGAVIDGRSARKPRTQAMHEKWRQKYIELKKKPQGDSDIWIAKQIEKLPIAQGRNFHTIRKNMKPQKKVDQKLIHSIRST